MEPGIKDGFLSNEENKILKKRRIIIYLTIIFIVLLIAVIITLVVLLTKKKYNEISCQYITNEINEEITLINNETVGNLDFDLIINGKSVEKKYSAVFENVGIQNITFIFK